MDITSNESIYILITLTWQKQKLEEHKKYLTKLKY